MAQLFHAGDICSSIKYYCRVRWLASRTLCRSGTEKSAFFACVGALRDVFGHHATALVVTLAEAIMTALSLYKQSIPTAAHLAVIDPACLGIRHVAGTTLTGVPVRAAT
jgi:hypothetical protein